jgi:hypothetical protein
MVFERDSIASQLQSELAGSFIIVIDCLVGNDCAGLGVDSQMLSTSLLERYAGTTLPLYLAIATTIA